MSEDIRRRNREAAVNAAIERRVAELLAEAPPLTPEQALEVARLFARPAHLRARA